MLKFYHTNDIVYLCYRSINKKYTGEKLLCMDSSLKCFEM
jgi:hypothetical protein